MRRNEWFFLPGGCGPAINRDTCPPGRMPTTSLIWYEGGWSVPRLAVRRPEVRGQAGEGLPLIDSIHGAPNGGCLPHARTCRGAARSRCPARDAVVGRACRATASKQTSRAHRGQTWPRPGPGVGRACSRQAGPRAPQALLPRKGCLYHETEAATHVQAGYGGLRRKATGRSHYIQVVGRMHMAAVPVGDTACRAVRDSPNLCKNLRIQ
jgi:hypothetical protein